MSCGVITQRGNRCKRKQSPCFDHVNGPVPRGGDRRVPGPQGKRKHRIRTTTGRGAGKRALTGVEQSRLIDFVTFLATLETGWMSEVERRLASRIDGQLVGQLKRQGRERYLSATADALDNPASALCRALERGFGRRMSSIERLLVKWIIANLLFPGIPLIGQFGQVATLLRILDILMAAQSGRELGIRVCTTKLLERQREVAIEFVISTALHQVGL